MKNYLLLSAVGAMMLAGCNDENVPIENPDAQQTGSVLTLSLNSAGDVATRADRPVYSSEAANNVTAVRLYIYNPAGADVTSTALATGTQNPITWTAGPTDSAAPGTNPNHKASQTVKLNKLAVDGEYTVVAYGYNAVLDYTISGGANASTPFTATLPALTKESELFAGTTTVNVLNGNIQSGMTSEVIMRRHVAGLLGYFKNIPILYPDPNALGLPAPVAFVRVYATSHSTAFTFPSTQLVNATGDGSNTKVLEYNLATSLLDYAAQVLAAGTDLTKKFNIPAIATSSYVTVPNSVIAGRFLIPFAKVGTNSTFTVQLEGATGNVLKTWNVVNNDPEVMSKTYDVQRNHFYSLGQKYKANTTDGGTPAPGGPTTDDDNPIDLSQETVLTITVNDAWDAIYNLGIE